MVILVSRVDREVGGKRKGKRMGQRHPNDEANGCFRPNGKSDCAFVFGCLSLSSVVPSQQPSLIACYYYCRIMHVVIFSRQGIEMKNLASFSYERLYLYFVLFFIHGKIV